MLIFNSYKYAYLVGCLFYLIIWLVIFFVRKDLRKEQIMVSVFGAIIAPIADYFVFYRDYWRPEYFMGRYFNGVLLGIESPLFGFLIVGISSVIYEVLSRRKSVFSKPKNILVFVILIVCILGTVLLNSFGVNSLWASCLMLTLCSIYMIYLDKHLIKDMIWSSISISLLAITMYVPWFWIYPDAYHRFWLFNNLSGIIIGRIPIEEIIWFFCAALFFGILYEFWRNVKQYKRLK